MHIVQTQVRRKNAHWHKRYEHGDKRYEHGDKRYAHGSMSSNIKIIDNTITSMNFPNIHNIFNEIFQRQLLQKNMDN